MTPAPRALPPVLGPAAPPALAGVRRSMGGLALVGAVVTLVPGVLVYLGLRALGLGIGGAGLIGLVLEFVGCFAYCGWLFGRGRAAVAAAQAQAASAQAQAAADAAESPATST